jgi:predicted nucleotidyltransferase component of viral defense system
MANLTRQQLELINRRTLQYPLPIAEKDYFLALAVKLIYSSQINSSLVFKGGTALHHCYLKQYRFSEDLDFTSLDKQISMDELISILESDGTFRVNKKHESNFTLKIERLQYLGLLGLPGNIKVEVDRHQNVSLRGIIKDYGNHWQVNTQPLVMDSLEVCSEKIRATAQRARFRDFYDLYLLVNELNIDIKSSIKLLMNKEIRSPVTSKDIAMNWKIAQEQMKGDIGSIYISKEIPISKIDSLIDSIQFDDIRPNTT